MNTQSYGHYIVSCGPVRRPVTISWDNDHLLDAHDDPKQLDLLMRERATRMARWLAETHHEPARIDHQRFRFSACELVVVLQPL